jgi:hypothetical protein
VVALAKRAWATGVTITACPNGPLLWRWPDGDIMRAAAPPREPNVRWVVERTMCKRGPTLS